MVFFTANPKLERLFLRAPGQSCYRAYLFQREASPRPSLLPVSRQNRASTAWATYPLDEAGRANSLIPHRGTLLGGRPDNPARRRRPDTVERPARRDVERLEIVVTEGTVRDLVSRHRQEVEELAVGAEHVNAPLPILGRLKGRVRLVQASRDVQPSFLILLEPVRTAAGAPVKQGTAAAT